MIKSMPLPDIISKRYAEVAVSQAHRDITDDKYRELRRPRKVRFFVNGDRYYPGKKLHITPHRYMNFSDLLNDLTGKISHSSSLPYGVRSIYTPVGGHRVKDIEDLEDKASYVCGGFESFKAMKYGRYELEHWSVSNPHRHDLAEGSSGYGGYGYGLMGPSFGKAGAGDSYGHGGHGRGYPNRYRGYYGNDGFHPGKYIRGQPGQRWGGGGTVASPNYRHGYIHHAEGVPMKPKVITIIRNGSRPRNTVKLLLNKRSIQSYEHLMADISDAFGQKWKNNKVRKLYNLKGKEVQSVSDFFRDDDVFIGVGNDKLTNGDVNDIIEELYPDSPYAKNLARDKEKRRGKRRKKGGRDSGDPNESYDSKYPDAGSKKDSGFGDSSDNGRRDWDPAYVIYKGRPQYRDKKEQDHSDREKAARRRQKELDAQRKAQEEEKRKKRQVPMKPTEDPFEKMKNDRDREEAKRRKAEEAEAAKRKKAAEDEAARQKAAEDAARKRAEDDARRRAKEDTDRKKAEEAEDDERDRLAREAKRNAKPTIVRKTKQERQSDPNDVLGVYELGRVLGDGNFAVVKQATHKPTGLEYAMKIIDKPKIKGKEHMVESEIDVMKDCNHPNIVKLYEEFETPENIYLVMELVKGGDLFDAITQSVKFDEVTSAGMVKDLASALFYLHSRNVVHRDLKPENLLVHRNTDGSLSLKLADFGLAMELKDLIYTVCGTPTYVAPEILEEKGYGLEVDNWAIGVICYILLCGFPPFRSADRNQTELFEFIKTGEYDFLMPYWENISEPARDLVEHLLVVDIKKRYTAQEVLCHPWILNGGDTMTMPDRETMDEMSREMKASLDAERISLEDSRKTKQG